MKILAIGATGFIGSRVTHQLMAQGHQVALFHRGSTTASDLDSVLHFHGTRHQLPNFKAVYGPGDEQHRFLAYLQQMFDQQPILLDEKQAHWRFSHGYVDNIAAAIALAVTDDRAAGQVYNLGEPETPPLMERIQRLGTLVNWTEVTTRRASGPML